MSRIKRLSIRGIRNFSDEKESEPIVFTRPMTLILGPNGTGKTTIIECLRYATTGDFPPGTDAGRCFIFDPKLTSNTSVRGVIKAEVINRKGDSMVVSKTVECTQLAKSMKLKSLDSTITRTEVVSKKRSQISGRCADITAEITRALGVSKPIINYVIFCHQEEFNWPFEEGKKLKEKFDEIFGTTMFNKALDNLRSLVKSHTAEIKVLKVEKDKYRILVDQVKTMENKIEELNNRKERSLNRIEEITNELLPLQEKIQENENKEFEYKKIIVNEDKKKMELNIAKKEVDNLKSTIHKIYDGTTDELKHDLEMDENFLAKKQEEIKEFENQVHSESKKEQQLSSELAEQRVQIGTLQQKMEDHNNRITVRNSMLTKALATFDTNIELENNTEDEIEEWMKTLTEKFEKLESDVEETRRQNELEEQILQKEVDTVRAEKSRIESVTNVRDKELLEIRKEIKTVQSEIAEVGIAGTKLNEIEMKLREVNNRCEALCKKMDVNVVKENINEKKKNQKTLDNDIHKLDEEITLMHQYSSLQAELDMQKSSLESKQKNIQSIKNKHESNIKTLFKVDEVPMRKLKNDLDEVYQTLTKEKDSYNHKLEREKVSVTSLQASLKHVENDLRKKEEELKNDKAVVSIHCDYENYDDIVAEQLMKVNNLQDDRGMYAYKTVAFKKYLEKVDSTDPCCPLCSRGFKSSQEAKNLSHQMKDEMNTVPQVLKNCEDKLKVEQKKYDSLLRLKPIVDKILKFEKTDSKQWKETIEQKTKSLRESKEKMNAIRSALEEPEHLLDVWKNLSSDIVLWDQSFNEIEKINRQIESVKRRIPSAGMNFDRTMDEAQKEKTSLRTSLKNLQKEVENMQTELDSHNEKVEKAKSMRLLLQEEKLRLSANMQKLQQFHDKETELSSKKDKLLKVIQEFKQELVTAEDQLETAIENLEKKKIQNSESVRSNKFKIDMVSKRIFELTKTQNEIENFLESKIEVKLQRVEERVKSYDEKISTLKESKSKLEKKIASLREDMAQQELSKRTLLDNLKLRKKEDELESLNLQWEHLKTSLKNFKIDDLRRVRRSFKEEEDKLIREKNNIEGMQNELSRSIRELKSQLRNKELKDAIENFKIKTVELIISEETIENFKAYSKILDASMIDFHEERMKTVNKVMDRLWRKVYTGHDTSTIQIHTSATEGMDTNRRSYNYKLVQKKNGVLLDMKGRCSAGQRVLTSIIIRMALAETFCGGCGVMALDEPTTNLDAENSRSLAEALCEIVAQRSEVQKNFQLIVISHDEPFISLLLRNNSHKSYYELKRAPDGRSIIQLRDKNGYTLAKPIATLDESSEDEDIDVDTVRV